MNSTPEDTLLLSGRMMEVSRLATIGEMMSGVAHELNQPLAAINNYSQACIRLLAVPNPDMADVNEALREISAQAMRAADIIRRMRALARRDVTECAHANPSELIDELSHLIASQSSNCDVLLRWSLPRDLPPVLVDSTQIQHALLNLARNAMEALAGQPAGTRELTIGARAEHGFVEFFVCDNGPGVAQEHVPHLSEPFFTTKPAGTGLGLAVADTIARAHDGQFVYRPNVPSGACFALRIPEACSAAPPRR